MRRYFAVIAIAGTLFLGLATPAGAEPGTNPRTFKSASPAAGQATANATAAEGGDLSAETTATGGKSSGLPGLLGIPFPLFPSGPASSIATASVETSDSLEPGTYTATVTFTGVEGVAKETGSGVAVANVSVAVPNPFGHEPGEQLTSGLAPVSTTPGTVVVEVEFEVVTPGAYSVVASTNSQSQSRGDGTANTATSRASADSVDIVIAEAA